MLRKWTRRVATISVSAIVLPFFVVALARMGGCETMVVKSASMGTAIPVGSLAVGKRVAAPQVAEGDVILVQPREGRDSMPYLHRVVSVERRGGQASVVTRGDANRSNDPEPYVLPGTVIRSEFSLPWMGYLIGTLSNPRKLMLLILLVAPLLALGWYLRRSFVFQEGLAG